MRLAARMQKKQWHILPADPIAGQLVEALKIPPILAQVLVNRQIKTVESAKSFLNPKLNDLIEPERMPGMIPAVDRIEKAVREKQKITIYGDYDVDGITAVAILDGLFKLLGAQVDYYIPHRVDEGYGLNIEAIEQISHTGTKLLISVDCGITAFDSALAAKDKGIDLIITDHHRPSPDGKLPHAVAIVHPNLDKNYPAQSSSGAQFRPACYIRIDSARHRSPHRRRGHKRQDNRQYSYGLLPRSGPQRRRQNGPRTPRR
jgi:single-stranded-DNA-specific exonuclease